MKRLTVITIVSIALVAAASLVLVPDEASAVPSFARQKGKACTDCHTIWPRLTQAGREFKELGYTEVGETYPRIQEDNLDLLGFSGTPLSVSLITLPYVKAQGQQSEAHIPEEMAIFLAGRITPNIGGFVEPKWARDTGQFSLELVKLAGANRVAGNNNLGIVFLKSDVAGADPYNTIRFTAYNTVNTPAIFTSARASGDLFQFASTENMGMVVNGRFFSNMVYVAAGAFRGDEFASNVMTDPIDGFGRIAFEYALTGESVASIGGYYYGGKQNYDHSFTDLVAPAGGGSIVPTSVSQGIYSSKFERYGADFQWQTDSQPHLFEVVGVYMYGTDKGAWDGIADTPADYFDVSFTGYYAEGSYFYNRKYGVTIGYDHIESSEDNSLDKKGPTFNIMYLPWLNTKFAIEYSDWEHANKVKERVTSALVHLYF
jgi:hypothetical protein